MKFTSTRNKNICTGFSNAIIDCMPEDGGLYTPLEPKDLRRQILYMDKSTSFNSIAGSLTSAFINEEFSPAVGEAIASAAFPFSPEIKQLDEKLFILDLSQGAGGKYRDFGISYLASCIEAIMRIKNEHAVFLSVSTGYLGASLAWALRGKKNIKAVTVYPKGTVKGIIEKDFSWNGGNVYPLEVNGSIEDCRNFVREVFKNKTFIKDRNLTVANTSNIGRLLPQTFFFPFAFSRIKSKINCDIYYALDTGDYGNTAAGLYSWQFALPVNGFIFPATDALTTDIYGNPILLDSIVPLSKRLPADPFLPSNIERLENIFSTNKIMMRHFLFPVSITEKEIISSIEELFLKYKIYADKKTASAYACVKLGKITEKEDDFATVLVASNHASLSKEYIRHILGESPEMPENIKKSLIIPNTKIPTLKSVKELYNILEKI